MNKVISVSVLGVAGAGKTSSIVAMLDHLKKDFFENTDLSFAIDSLSGRLIMDQKARLVSSLEKGAMESKDGIKPTREVTKYYLNLGKKGAESPLPMAIEFVDYPGNWLNNGNSDDLSQVKEFVANSKVLIIPIDAACLMEMNEDAQPNIILDILTEAYANLTEPRMVILAPVKCEKYYDKDDTNPNKAYHSLIMKIQERYENVLSFLTSKPVKKDISLVIIPIQTLGSCKLMYFSETDEGNKMPVFVVTQRGVYVPKNTDQPFLYLLSFILKDQYEDKNAGFPGVVRRLFGSHNYLNTTSEELSQLCLTNEGIKVIQNSRISTF